jgi:hypothetical protein
MASSSERWRRAPATARRTSPSPGLAPRFRAPKCALISLPWEPIEDGVGYLAAYMNMIMVWQDLDQLERINSRAWSIKPDSALILLVIPNDGKQE